MSKWDRLIEYLETTTAKPDKVLASVKAVFKPKGQSKIEYTDSYITRKAYTALTCHAIYNAKKDNPYNGGAAVNTEQLPEINLGAKEDQTSIDIPAFLRQQAD